MNEWKQLTMTICPHCNRLISCSPQPVCKLCRSVDKPAKRTGFVVKSRCVGSTERNRKRGDNNG